MSRPTCWSELTDARVGVWGLGVEGGASVRKLRSLGVTPVLVDDSPSANGFEGVEVVSTEHGGLDVLGHCDVVVKSPGISRYRPEVAQLERAGVEVSGGLGLWLEEKDRSRVACITGTKGKSTTTALCVHFLAHLGYKAAAGGNIGRPPWDPQGDEDEPDFWVIETSSFQVPDVTTAPPVVAVTSLSPDHLDWHGSVERYYADKLSLCTKPGVTVALVEGNNAVLREQRAALGPHLQWVNADEGRAEAVVRSLRLAGDHNARNARVALAVLDRLGVAKGDSDARLVDAARTFAGLPSRCYSLGFVDGIEFVDDSLSTNVLPAQAALAAYEDRPVALLVGGKDRGLDYAPLGRTVAARNQRTLVVTLPDNGPRIGAAIAASEGTAASVVDAADLESAVRASFEWAAAGTVVLLSPAAPSFGQFTDYRDRAEAFAAAAARCGPLTDQSG
jgi:UDP-N-acetylmuramoylalanine--D-glutamate ligase